MATDQELALNVRLAWAELASAILKADGEGLRVQCENPSKVFDDPANVMGTDIIITKEF